MKANKSHGNSYSDSEIKEIITVYQQKPNRTATETAKILSKDRCTVTKILRERKLIRQPRTYFINELVWFTPSVDRDYWIGFLMADGCVRIYSKNNKGNGYSLGLEIGSKDFNHLVKYKSFWQTDYPIKKQRNCVFLRIENKNIVLQSIKFGLVPRKSIHAVVFKEFENNIDFWRGMVDGDGTISTQYIKLKTGKISHSILVGLTGTKSVCESFAKFIFYHTGKKYKISSCKPDNCYKVTFRNRQAVLTILKLLYKNSSTYLDRKYQRAMDAIRHLEGNDF